MTQEEKPVGESYYVRVHRIKEIGLKSVSKLCLTGQD